MHARHVFQTRVPCSRGLQLPVGGTLKPQGREVRKRAQGHKMRGHHSRVERQGHMSLLGRQRKTRGQAITEEDVDEVLKYKWMDS